MTRVEAKGYLFSARNGLHPIVVSTEQGQNPVKNQDSELVPVGAGKLQGGGSPAISDIGLSVKSQIPFGFEQAYRVRAYTVFDVSKSMEYSSGVEDLTRLELARQKITTYAEGLNASGVNDIEHILVPFCRTAGITHRTRDTKDLIKQISNLETKGGTDFTAALDVVLEDINADRNNQARNLIVFISDGIHRRGREDLALKISSNSLYLADCATYLVGVGDGYDQAILKDLLQRAKFGGLTHLPHPKLDVFKDILPPFVAGMRTAPYYPIVSFSNKFQRVVSVMPSVRDVIQERYDYELSKLIPNENGEKHFPAVTGYMLKNYAVGFVKDPEEPIYLVVKDSPNGKPLEVRRIEPEEFDQAILDPTERELIKGMPSNVELVEILAKRDLKQLEEFIKDNFDNLNQKQKKLIIDEIKNLKGPKGTTQGETCTRERETEAASDVSERVFQKGKPVNALSDLVDHFRDDSNLGIDNSGNAPSLGGLLHSGELGPLDRSGTVGSLPDIQGPRDVNPVAYDKAVPPIKITLELFPQPGITISQNTIEVSSGKAIIFGRRSDSDVVISGNGSVSRSHFSVLREGNDIYVRDHGSSNGTFVNSQQIAGDTLLKSGDVILVAGTMLRVKIDS